MFLVMADPKTPLDAPPRVMPPPPVTVLACSVGASLPRRPVSFAVRLITRIAALATLACGGCIVQLPAANTLERTDLPPQADSGILLDSQGFQPDGLRAVWREDNRVYLLTERTRLGPITGTPFGPRPNDELTTVEELPEDAYEQNWHIMTVYNMWITPAVDAGLLHSEVSYRTFRCYQMLLFKGTTGGEKLHKGQLAQSSNSPLLRDHIVRGWEQGIEYLERFMEGQPSRAVYLIREAGQLVRRIPVNPDSQPELLAELAHPQANRRAAAATLLGHIAGEIGSDATAAVAALVKALDAPEPDSATRSYIEEAISRFYGIGNLDLEIAARVEAMTNRPAAERLKQAIMARVPGSGLVLDGQPQTP